MTDSVAPPEFAVAAGAMPLEVALITDSFKGKAVPANGCVPDGDGVEFVPVVAASGCMMLGTEPAAVVMGRLSAVKLLHVFVSVDPLPNVVLEGTVVVPAPEPSDDPDDVVVPAPELLDEPEDVVVPAELPVDVPEITVVAGPPPPPLPPAHAAKTSTLTAAARHLAMRLWPIFLVPMVRDHPNGTTTQLGFQLFRLRLVNQQI